MAPRLIILTLALVLLGGAAPVVAAPVAGGGSDQPVAAGPPVPTGAVRPVPGGVSRPFDPPADPYGPGHRGVDLQAAPGQPVHAALSGTVTFSGLVATVGWVSVDHGGGLVTTYGPLEDRVAQGAAVAAGTIIGRVAGAQESSAAGPTTSPDQHLDWGARLDGAYIDPMLLLRRWTLRLTAPERVGSGQLVPVA